MKWIKQSTIALSIPKLGILIPFMVMIGCVSAPQLDVDLCGINFASDKPAHLHCYNTKKDYTDGVLTPGAKAHDIPISSPAMLNAGKYVSRADWKKVEAWAIELRQYGKEHCK